MRELRKETERRGKRNNSSFIFLINDMIVIQWYNLVAIIVGIIFAWRIIYLDRNGRSLGDGLDLIATVFLCLLFFAIWGGIFWW